MKEQKVLFSGEFEAKIELLPLQLVSDSVSPIFLAAFAVFSFLAITFFSFAFDAFSPIKIPLYFGGIMTPGILMYLITYYDKRLQIEADKVSSVESRAFMIKKVNWSELLSNYSSVCGKYYYGYIGGSDTPTLVREVVLKNINNSARDFILARYFFRSEDLVKEENFKSFWRKSCIIFGKNPSILVNGTQKDISSQDIEFLNGDEGAFIPDKRMLALS